MEDSVEDTSSDAPRITLLDVLAAIVGETFTVLPNGRTTVCQLTLDNGFTVEGTSACVSLANFDPVKGNAIAKANALDQVWKMLGFRLSDRMANMVKTSVDEGDTEVSKAVELGDKVLFYERVGDQESAPMLAFVSAVLSPRAVSLTILAPNGTAHARERVTLVYPWEDTPALAFYARAKR